MPLGLSGCGNMRDDITKAIEIAKGWTGEAGGLTKVNSIIKDQIAMIPPAVVENAHGICFLFFIRAGMLYSGELGTGFVLSKLNPGTPDQRWSAPTAITAGGMGFGALIGAQKVSHVVILNNPRVVKSFASNAKVNFGADVGVAAGPVGRNVDAKLAAGDKGISATYSYSYSQGLYAGIQLDGMVITQNPTMNQNFYGSKHSPRAILNGEAGTDAWQFCPELANLYQVLDGVLGQAPNSNGASIFRRSSERDMPSAPSATGLRQQADDLFGSFTRRASEAGGRSGRGGRGGYGVDLNEPSRRGGPGERRESPRNNPYNDLYDSREYDARRYDEYDRSYGSYRETRTNDRFGDPRESDRYRSYDREQRRDYYDEPPRGNRDDYDRHGGGAYRVADDDDYDYDRRRDDRRR